MTAMAGVRILKSQVIFKKTTIRLPETERYILSPLLFCLYFCCSAILISLVLFQPRGVCLPARLEAFDRTGIRLLSPTVLGTLLDTQRAPECPVP